MSEAKPTQVRLPERADAAAAQMQQEALDLLALAKVAGPDQAKAATGAAQMITEWLRVLKLQQEALAARQTLFNHIRLTLVQALDDATAKVEKGVAVPLVLSDFSTTLDHCLPPAKK